MLLTAALMPMTTVHQEPVRHARLPVKVSLPLVYIVLGYCALRAESRERR